MKQPSIQERTDSALQHALDENDKLRAINKDMREALKLAKKMADAVVKQVSRDNIEVLMARATITQALAKAEVK